MTSPTARRILLHWADPRPAWLWSHDGTTLLWRNAAARLFNARIKKHGLKLSAEAVPIKGQVSRLIRLGSLGRSSLSRVQFLAGGKPVANTCSCTPLTMPAGETVLLLVGVDPISDEIRDAAGGFESDAMSDALFPAGARYQLLETPAETAADDTVRIVAGPTGAMLVFTTDIAPTIADVRDEEGVSADERPDLETEPADQPEPMLPLGIAPLPETAPTPAPDTDNWVEPQPPPAPDSQKLSSLFDRLAGHPELYAPLPPTDAETEAAPAEPVAKPEQHQPAVEPRTHWMITGRGVRPAAPPPPPSPAPDEAAVPTETPAGPAAVEPAPAPPPPRLELQSGRDADAAERVSRYNFEELGRILTDRVASEPRPEAPAAEPAAPRPPSAVVSLNAEALVLNRLPLAVLVFRDQQVLFANRALTDLLRYESVESLRAAGIAAIFPVADAADAGPVDRLVRRDGTPLSVSARLQSVSWQGRPALMLSASSTEPVRGHEGAVRAFAEIAAETRDEGFIAADRAGIVTFVSATGRALLDRPETDMVGRPLTALISRADLDPLRVFLEKPARFAETTRPHLIARSDDGAADLVLFAEGQAGIVSGYFGFIRKHGAIAPPAPGDADFDPGMLGRLSRGIRRPLNTIIGFADLLRTTAEDPNATDRTVEYARDIRTAGLEIAVLADELDDFTRLQDGRYAPRPSDVDLAPLLASCMVRVRAQAAAARVLVRSSISEQLPRIRADRASLGQALLNLLASAIDQTPIGGSVILSAQAQADGGIAIHVRDGAQIGADLGERFVVFRDGIDKDGEQLQPVRSSVGLALTRSLLAVNACSLSVAPTIGTGTLFSLLIPTDLVVAAG